MICVNCGEQLVRTNDSNEMKIRGKITLIKGGHLYTVCKSCNAEVQMPVSVNIEPMVSSPKLFITKKR